MFDMFISGMENENDMFDIGVKIFFVNVFEYTGQFLKIQTKYRPIFGIFFKRSVLQTKIIFTDHWIWHLTIKCKIRIAKDKILRYI